MKLSDMALHQPGQFALLCETLRKNGVTELGPLKLGPLPNAASHREREVDPNAEARRKHEVMFAAVRRKPPFVPPADTAEVPRAVAQRRAHEAANGEAVTQR